MTIGIVPVACLAARAAGRSSCHNHVNLKPNQLVGEVGNRSARPSAERYSITKFCPSAYPSSLSPCRNAARLVAFDVTGTTSRTPIR